MHFELNISYCGGIWYDLGVWFSHSLAESNDRSSLFSGDRQLFIYCKLIRQSGCLVSCWPRMCWFVLDIWPTGAKINITGQEAVIHFLCHLEHWADMYALLQYESAAAHPRTADSLLSLSLLPRERLGWARPFALESITVFHWKKQIKSIKSGNFSLASVDFSGS